MPRLRLDQLALFPAAIAAGLGLGLAALAALAPAVPVAVPPPVAPSAPSALPQTVASRAFAPAQWPTLFGIEIAAPPEPAEDPLDAEPTDLDLAPEEPIEEEVLVQAYDIDSLILRGLVSDGAGGGTAVIETPEGQVTVARGDSLPDGAFVAAILFDTVEIEFQGDYYSLGFRIAPPRPGTELPISPLAPSRRAVRDEPSLDESEFPVYIGEEQGPAPPRDGFGLSR